MDILICGDSFASELLSDGGGWSDQLKKYHNIQNLAKPGVGEYKILQQLVNSDLSNFDKIIVSHTSPYRVHTNENLLYDSDHIYRMSDYIYSDVQSKLPKSKWINDYFRYAFDESYYKFIHNKICEEIDIITKQYDILHITHFQWDDLYCFDNLKNFYHFWLNNKGKNNHYDEYGNRTILNEVLKWIGH